ncbi:MAG: radical SAM protein [Ruminococcaceae bacterium]|nr:radical SAM protein [Oscillospiraceae bacterium]
MLYLFQKGFHYNQDGPGNRLIYHLQGCNMRCPWCSNPEGLSFTGGDGYTVDALVDEVKRSRPMFFDGGGVTLTGGEVTGQADGALALLSRVHGMGVSTCIETNGTSPRLPAFFPHLDLLIMDVKHYDTEKHRAVTGVSNEMTIKNLALALEAGVKTLLRIPLIGTFNASEADAHGFAALFSAIKEKGDFSVELLSYHEYGRTKYEKLGLPYTMGKDAFVSREAFEKFATVLRDAGIKLITT